MIEKSLAKRLMELFGHKRVYANSVPLVQDNDAFRLANIEDEKEAITYRIVGGNKNHECIGGGSHGPRTDRFLVEFHSRQPHKTFEMRDRLEKSIDEDVDLDLWQEEPNIHVCSFSDVASGEDFSPPDTHGYLQYSRAIITITHSRD